MFVMSYLMPLLGVIPCEYVNEHYNDKNTVNGLYNSGDHIILHPLVLTQYQRVTDRDT